MKHLLVHVKGNAVTDLINALDGGVLASVELGDKDRKAEAPDKSGGYHFKLYDDSCPVSFDDLENESTVASLTKQVEELKAKLESVSGKLDVSKDKNEELSSDYLELKKVVTEAKAAKPAKRLRAY